MVTIKTYSEQYKSDFIRLNTEWIRTWFDLEESDLHTFANIDSYIIGGGGQIFIAVDDGRGEAVGCAPSSIIPKRRHMNWQRWPFPQRRRGII